MNIYIVSKKADAFHIQISHEHSFRIMVNYAKEELKFLNSFIRPRAIRMHFDSHSELDLCPTGWLKKT